MIEEGPKALETPKDYEVRSNLMWAATLALNGLIGAGVPQDWATHMIGHELTAMHGLDHAQTLAVILLNLLDVCRQGKQEKLIQYAERIWGINEGDNDQRIYAAIDQTRKFFERMQIKTRLSDYDIGNDSIPDLQEKLKAHGMIRLGERQEITLDVSKKFSLSTPNFDQLNRLHVVINTGQPSLSA